MDRQNVSDELAELKARYERLKLLYQVGNVIHSTLEPQEALQLIVSEAVRLMRASSGSVVLINPTTGFLEIHASKALPASGAEPEIARRRRHHRLGGAHRESRARRRRDPGRRATSMVRRDVRSELAVPLEVNGEVRGVLNVDSDRRTPSAPTTRNCSRNWRCRRRR